MAGAGISTRRPPATSEETPIKKWRKVTVKPGPHGVITIAHDFWSDHLPDPYTGEWEGWVEDK